MAVSYNCKLIQKSIRIYNIPCCAYPASTKYQRAGVQYIIDSVIKALVKNPKRRFIGK